MRASKTLHSDRTHVGWNRDLAPQLIVNPGDEILFEVIDASNLQLSPTSTVEDVEDLNLALVNPTTGPVHVEGAMPGDGLEITFLSFGQPDFGWSALIPGFGLLSEDFPEPFLVTWHYDDSPSPSMTSDHSSVPFMPFAGTIGVAPADPGTHSVVPPRNVGGNMDIRDLRQGAKLLLPVEVPGALLSIGDTHAAQGDGEVCGTAIETSLDVLVSINLLKGQAPKSPTFETPSPSRCIRDVSGYLVTTGIGPDLYRAAQCAVREMIALLANRGVPPEVAYILSSVAGDLRISEIVDAPNWVVTFHFPKSIEV